MVKPHETETRELGSVKVEDVYTKTFQGGVYTVGGNDIRTVGDLRSRLQLVVDDLGKLAADADSLEVSDVDLRDGQISYTLREGIVQ